MQSQSDGASPARVFLRPIGSPLTIGMSGLAIASLVQAGLDLHWIPVTQTHMVGLILISVPFVLQVIACLYSYLARDGAAGAALGVLSVTWLGLGLVHLNSVPGVRSGALGLLLLAAGGVLALSALAVIVQKPLPGLVFALSAARFVLAGVYELGASSGWQNAAGIVSLVVTGLAGYCVLAFELEGEMHRPVLPTFRRGSARAAILGGPSAQVDQVANEAGVRQTT
jgi:succinate-acetate transporter protein